ncbi:hypothetical protein CTEN210_05542 [Chaetoceros tenuissimus]|uniref:Uncharacterized protein n=1 Tax=Chaetoceros tenuissimus TaxID=426638 RepID=A0AAD3H3L8_9STRA|nr:hypothetical protein CTEN210_05542 [Chaetoceros tenuissimus]
MSNLIQSSSSLSEELNTHISDLFLGPTQGIEKALHYILGLIQEQDKKHVFLREQNEELRDQNQALLKNVSTLQESNLEMLDKLKYANEILKDNHILQSKVKVLEESTQDLREELFANKYDLKALQFEVNVMSHNLQLDDDDMEESHEGCVDPTDIEKQDFDNYSLVGESIDLDNEEREQKESSSGEPSSEEVPMDISTDDQEELQPEGKTVSDENDAEKEMVCDVNSKNDETQNVDTALKTKNSKWNIVKSRRASIVTTRELKKDKTLSARLKRLENDAELMQTEVNDIKNMLDKLPGTIPSSSSQSDLQHFNRRVSLVESFLSGFGAMDNDGAKHRFIEDPEIKEEVDEEVNKNDATDSSLKISSSGVESSKNHGDSCLAASEPSTSNIESTIAPIEMHSPISSDRPNTGTTVVQTTFTQSQSDNDEATNQSESKEPSSRITNAFDADNTKVANSKRQGLLLHLIDQEKRLKKNISNISSRLLKLESNCEESRKARLVITEPADSDVDPIHSLEQQDRQVNATNEEIDQVKISIQAMKEQLDTKVSRTELNNEMAKLSQQTHNESMELVDEVSNEVNSPTVQEQINLLDKQKASKTEVNDKLQQISTMVDSSMASNEESLQRIFDNVSDCKERIAFLENQGPTEDVLSLSVEERIRNATESITSNMNDVISTRLEGLKVVEKEMDRITSKLADKPDQKQITEMLQDLEKSVLKHVGIDDTVKAALANVKSDLNDKVTREQVLGLVKKLLRGTKERITKNSGLTGDSLMIGYKCIGCNDVHPDGVNHSMATKVNHNALPLGRSMTPPMFPYCQSLGTSSMPKRVIVPLRRRSTVTTRVRPQMRSLHRKTR